MSKGNTKEEVSVTAYWGNGDAESTIALLPEQWQSIQDGGEHVEHSESWYEGQNEEVIWSFMNGVVTIDGEDGRQCVIDSPICELHVGENY